MKIAQVVEVSNLNGDDVVKVSVVSQVDGQSRGSKGARWRRWGRE